MNCSGEAGLAHRLDHEVEDLLAEAPADGEAHREVDRRAHQPLAQLLEVLEERHLVGMGTRHGAPAGPTSARSGCRGLAAHRLGGRALGDGAATSRARAAGAPSRRPSAVASGAPSGSRVVGRGRRRGRTGSTLGGSIRIDSRIFSASTSFSIVLRNSFEAVRNSRHHLAEALADLRQLPRAEDDQRHDEDQEELGSAQCAEHVLQADLTTGVLSRGQPRFH